MVKTILVNDRLMVMAWKTVEVWSVNDARYLMVSLLCDKESPSDLQPGIICCINIKVLRIVFSV